MVTQPPVSVGWEFESHDAGVLKSAPVRFTTTGNYSFNLEREVTRTISGFVLLPEDRRLLNFASARVLATLVLDGVRHPMGTFVFTEDIAQKNVVLDTDEPDDTTDLTNVALADRSALLLRNDGTPQTLWDGFDPAHEIENLVVGVGGFPASIEASDSANTQAVTWDGTVTDLAKVRQLAELAGHHPPWVDNNGVMRSVSASRIYGTVLEMERDVFLAQADSVTVTSNYLTVPNRVIVTSSSSAYQIRGEWNAPSSWLSSAAQRGYVRTIVEEVQGLQSNADAERVAATIGKRLTARQLTARVMPTHLLDGPRVLRYDDTLWTVRSGNMTTAPGATLSFEAEELFVDDIEPGASLTIPGVI